MAKRALGAYCALLVCFGLLFARMAYLGSGESLAQAAHIQSSRTMTVAAERALIYDRFFTPLVSAETKLSAVVFPGLAEPSALARLVPKKEKLASLAASGAPFVTEAPENIADRGIFTFETAARYSGEQLAEHLIGYLAGGEGAAGAELAFNEFLSTEGRRVTVTYEADGAGGLLMSTQPSIEVSGGGAAGVVLTIDGEVQRIVEDALARRLEKGAAVVMDVDSGEILASASLPCFDTLDLAASVEDEALPFLNRAFAAWPVGSTFKLVVTAAALEAGYSSGHTCRCTGSADISGKTFNCHWEAGHGEIDMVTALKYSCNVYFIKLALELGPELIRQTAANMGLGAADVFAEGWETASGHLQTASELRDPADVANFAFGQGSLSATPVQIAKMVSAIANGGFSVTPKLWLGTLSGSGEFTETEVCARNRVMGEDTAARLRAMMALVVEEGSGTAAIPVGPAGGAGGKTASAQTGQYGGDGEEKVEAWFAGFCPAVEPRYAVVVLAEGMGSGSQWAAPVFRDIANGLYALGVRRS